MKLDVNEISHQYIVRIVILALFIYKQQIRRTEIYTLYVDKYIKKRIPWKIDLKIDAGVRLNRDEERDLILEGLLNDMESDYLSRVTVSFTTPLKPVIIDVDLTKESIYEKFLYS